MGSLVAAVGSYLSARSKRGEWLLRIEDVDWTRSTAGAAEDIPRTLYSFGFRWDGPIVYQSQRTSLYEAALKNLRQEALTYQCCCSRKEIADSAIPNAAGERRYPGTCRERQLGPGPKCAERIRVDDRCISFPDRLLGHQEQWVDREVGDFVLRRADGVFSYQLAVVVDDQDQGITEVVRGADLLASTGRQIYLQQLLHYLAVEYAHLPLVLDANGNKLSKQTKAAPVDEQDPLSSLRLALAFLGQEPPRASDLHTFWRDALNGWDEARIPQTTLSA